MGPTLQVEDRGPVRWILFNRPHVHNAQNPEMLEKLARALDETRDSPGVRVVVLGGNGPSFCSGHDLRAISDDPEYARNAATAEGRYWQESRLFVEPVERFRNLPQPTICRIQGHCLAAGLMFVATADFSVAAEGSSFGSPVLSRQAVNDAEVPAFAWRVGERRAKQALWLNERFDAHEARQMGLVNWVVEEERLDQKVDEVAQRLLEVPPEALAISKVSFRFMAERLGERDVSAFHFVSHQFTHQTEEARALLIQRMESASPKGPANSLPGDSEVSD